MKIRGFLTISSRGALRITKNTPSLYQDEISVKLDINVPDAIFKRPLPTLSIDLPENVVANPDAELAVRLTAYDVSQALKIDVQEVQDGLWEMLRKRDKEAGRGESVS